MAGEKITRDKQQQAVLFAAGIGALMACLEHAVIVSLYMWRVWAFLALNLLLLAIAFTSKSSPIQLSNEIDPDDTAGGSQVVGRKMKKNVASETVVVDSIILTNKLECRRMECEPMEEDGDEVSKLELNRRAEAFIAMFRQHLVSDHAKSRIEELSH